MQVAPPHHTQKQHDEMSLAWEKLRASVENEDYLGAASILGQELNLSGPKDLMPILSCLLSAVAKIAGNQDGKSVAPGPSQAESGKFSAFLKADKQDVLHGKSDDTDTDKQDVHSGSQEMISAREWHNFIKAVFNKDAAMCLLDDLELCYAKPDLPLLLSGYLEPDLDNAVKMKRVEELCSEEVVGPEIKKYGFENSAAGIKEMNGILLSFCAADDALKKKMGKVELAGARLRKQACKAHAKAHAKAMDEQ